MSATNPLKRGLGAGPQLRAIELPDAIPAVGSACHPARQIGVLKCGYRPADANFYCWKYGVWYNLMDCCYRHARRTYSGCATCGQGRNNLRANHDRYLALRLHQDRPFSR